MPSVKTYDPKCGELAEHFLSDDPPKGIFSANLADERARVKDLALHIQQAVEDWFATFEVAQSNTERRLKKLEALGFGDAADFARNAANKQR